MRIFDIFEELPDSTESVTKLQKILNAKGADIEEDGIMGPETLAALDQKFPELIPPTLRQKVKAVVNKPKVYPVSKKASSITTRSNADSKFKFAFQDPEFIEKLKKVADNLGIESDTLAAIIYTESRGNPKAKDPFNVSAGLIGFTRKTAESLGTTRDKILSMPAVEQLDLVERYYKRVGVRPGMNRGTIYMLTFLPAFANYPDETVLGQENGGDLKLASGKSTNLSMHKVWLQNPVFGKTVGKSYFTVGDVKRHVNRMPSFNIDESITEDEVNPVDSIELDVPLLIRMLEYAREDAETDMDLHDVAEKMISLSQTGERLSMNDYDQIVTDDGPVEEAEWTTPIAGLSQKQDKATGLTTQRYQAGPIDTQVTKDPKGNVVGQNSQYRLNPSATVKVQQPVGSQITAMTGQATDPAAQADVDNIVGVPGAAQRKRVDPQKFAQFQQQLPAQEAMGGASAEEFLKNVEYRPQPKPKHKSSLMGKPMREGHGRYWCSTDKRWKERQGPKQSRG